MEETTELTVFVEQSGIEKSKGNAITESLNVFFAKAKEWDSTIQSIVINDVSEVGKMKMAREGRLTLKTLRLDSDKVVKAKRDEIKYRMANDLLEDKLWLKAGQMVEAVYKNLETKLEEKEKFAERKENERLENLKAERLTKLAEYPEFDPIYTDLKNMPEDSFNQLISGLQTAKEKRIEEEKAIEAARIKKEKEDAAERERIMVENERLKKESEKKEAALKAEREKVEAERNAAALKAAKEKAAIEEKARKEKEAAELKAKKEREAAAEKLRIEKEKSDKLKAELREKELAAEREKQAELKRIADQKKAEALAAKKAAAAPDKAKLETLATSISSFPMPDVKTEESKVIIADVEKLLNKVAVFIREKIEKNL